MIGAAIAVAVGLLSEVSHPFFYSFSIFAAYSFFVPALPKYTLPLSLVCLIPDPCRSYVPALPKYTLHDGRIKLIYYENVVVGEVKVSWKTY